MSPSSELPVMAFYSPDPAMQQLLGDLVLDCERQGRSGLGRVLSITWLRFPESIVGRGGRLTPEAFWGLPVAGASWGGERLRDPGSLVHLVYLVACEAWLQRQWLQESPELRRAMAAMVRHGCPDATSLVVDLLSGTTSGPSLPVPRQPMWIRQRQLVNDWMIQLGWPELQGCNACQKTWAQAPYGREADFTGPNGENRNRFSSEALARLFLAVIGGVLVSPPACGRMGELLAHPSEAPLKGSLAENLAIGCRLWHSRDFGARTRQEAAYLEIHGEAPMLLVAMVESGAWAHDQHLFPAIGQGFVHGCRVLSQQTPVTGVDQTLNR
jgi:hypothetical protein